jgi:hypothetical protein
MKIGFVRRLALLTVSMAAACGSGSSGATPQVVSGKAALSTFPQGVDTVRAVRSGQVIATAPVASDGSFAIQIPAGTGYRIELAAGASRAGLVFPRKAGTVDKTFNVRSSGAPFDLGAVRYVGDPTSHTYAFGASSAAAAVGCENGVDPATGAVCVDDAEGGGSCTATDADSVQCENGIDPVTGAPCDGGPDANPNDGSNSETTDGNETSGTEDTAGAPADAAVADKNLPSAVGCNEGDGA